MKMVDKIIVILISANKFILFCCFEQLNNTFKWIFKEREKNRLDAKQNKLQTNLTWLIIVSRRKKIEIIRGYEISIFIIWETLKCLLFKFEDPEHEVYNFYFLGQSFFRKVFGFV